MSFKITGAPIIEWLNRNRNPKYTINVYRSTSSIDPNNLPVPIAILPGNANIYNDTTVNYGETYHYIIGTSNGDVENLSDELVIMINRELSEPFDIDVKYYETDSGNLKTPSLDGIYDKFLGN